MLVAILKPKKTKPQRTQTDSVENAGERSDGQSLGFWVPLFPIHVYKDLLVG